MDTFGERLKFEREDRGLSPQAVAEALGVDDDRLQALERNDFDALPDEGAMMDYLRAYAECLDVDAELMIADYLRERERCLHRLAEAVTHRVEAIEPTALPPRVGRARQIPRFLAASVVFAAVAMVFGWWLFSRGGVASGPEQPVAAAPVEVQPTSPPREAEIARPLHEQPLAQPAAQPTEQPTHTVADSPVMSVPDYGVGTAVKDRQLVGRSDRFTAGTQVWFWTRVEGGSAGDKIDHVWLQGGVEAASIPLTVGGPSWRTYSAKTLRADSAGDWVVEARDATGRVLARHEFVCLP